MPVITLENGAKIRTFRPASGFDPLTASAAELDQNGFPPRPDDPRLLELYERVFGRLKGRLQYVEPTFQVNRDKSHDPRNNEGTNWSGGVIPPPGELFKNVHGECVVPNVYPTTKGGWSGSSYWIGLDGFIGPGANELCQVGVQSQVLGTFEGKPFVIFTYPFHQWFPDAQVQVTNLAISPGDLVTIALCTPTGPGSTRATVYFANITSGAATSYVFSAPTNPPTQLAGTSAEWIVDAPTIDGAPSQLADYGEVFFSSCGATTSNNNVVSGGTGEKVDLSQEGRVVSMGTLITPDVIQCSYISPHP